MPEKILRIWFSTIASTLINLLFGAGVGYIILAVLFILSQTFPSDRIKDYIDVGIYVLMSVIIVGGLCFWYNNARYCRMKKQLLPYRQMGFYITLLLPILLAVSGMLIFAFV